MNQMASRIWQQERKTILFVTHDIGPLGASAGGLIDERPCTFLCDFEILAQNVATTTVFVSIARILTIRVGGSAHVR
jgi:hypothetical protein